MDEAVDKSVELVVSIGLVAIGLAVGGPLMAGAVAGLGINLLSSHAQQGSRFLSRRLLGSPQATNADVEKAVGRAFRQAVIQLEGRWWTTHPRGHQLKRLYNQRTPSEQARADYEAAKGLFDGLREGSDRILAGDRLAAIAKRPEVLRLLDGTDAEIANSLGEALTSALSGHDPQLSAFIRNTFVNELAFCFTADLKTDAPAQNRSWRGYQKLLLDGLTDTLGRIETRQSELAAATARLTAWAEALDAAPAATRDPIGEDALDALVTLLGDRIDAAVVQLRDALAAGVARVEETTLVVGGLVVDAVVEGNRDLNAQLAEGFQAVLERLAAVPAPRPTGSRPPIWNVPDDPNALFWPRPAALAFLVEGATSEAAGAVVHALHGIGGAGKTQLAVAHVYAHLDHYDLVWWVRAETPAVLAADYAALAGALRLWEADQPDQAVAIAAVRRHLGQTADRWLLVFDNAEQVADLKPFLPQGGTGRVIVTSRNPVWAAIAPGRTREVGPLDPDDAVAFLIDRTGDPDRVCAGAIADETGCLPLALDQARAYVEQEGISLATYLALFRSNRAALLARGDLTTGYDQTTVTTFEVSFHALAERSAAGSVLATLCAFLAPEGIPLEAISARASDLPPVLAAVAGDELALTEAVGAARRYSLLQRTDDRTVAMHRLVQDAARTRLTAVDRENWAKTAVEVISAAFPDKSDDYVAWPASARLLPHALAAIDHADAAGVAPGGLSTLLNGLGEFNWSRGEMGEARLMHERALALREVALPAGHPDIATSLGNLAATLWALGDLAGARALEERALALREAALPPGHPDIAYSLNNLAVTLRGLGDLAGARVRLERALALREAALPAGHPDIGYSLNNLAVTLRDLGDLAGARVMHERALALREAALPAGHPDIANSVSNLAWTLRDQGNPAGARVMLERALALREAALPPGHPDIAMSLNSLATTLWDQGDLAGARAMEERALALREAALPAGHPDIAYSLNNLAVTLQGQGDLAGARVMFEQSLALREVALPAGHPDIANSLGNLAGTLRDLSEFALARSLYERALRINQSNQQRHPEAKNFAGLGKMVAALGLPYEGLQLMLACTVLNRELDRPDIVKLLEGVPELAATVGLDDVGLARLTDEVEAAYLADGGWGLIHAAFSDEAASDSGIPSSNHSPA